MDKKHTRNGSRLPDDWISPRRAGQLIAVSPSAFWSAIAPHVAPGETVKVAGRRYFDPRAIVAVHTKRIAQKLTTPDADPLMVGDSGGRSPALERYRAEKALLAKMEREEKEGSLIPRDLIRRAFTVAANLIRQAGELLQRDFGTAAADVLNRALDDSERETTTVFGKEKKR